MIAVQKQEKQVKKKEKIPIDIRWMKMKVRNIPEVLSIEIESFDFPWIEEDFICCLKQHNYAGMIAKHDKHIIGFMIYELDKTKTQIHVLNFAVASKYLRRKVGSRMIAELIKKLLQKKRKLDRIILEVCETNLPAQLFFRKNGFHAVAILRNFYNDTPEDAYLMQYDFVEKGFCPTNRILQFVR